MGKNNDKTRAFMESLRTTCAKQNITIPEAVETIIEPQVRDYYEADEQIKRDGLTIVDFRGDVKVHPLFRPRRECYDRIIGTLKAYGLTKNTTEGDDESPLAAFMNDGK